MNTCFWFFPHLIPHSLHSRQPIVLLSFIARIAHIPHITHYTQVIIIRCVLLNCNCRKSGVWVLKVPTWQSKPTNIPVPSFAPEAYSSVNWFSQSFKFYCDVTLISFNGKHISHVDLCCSHFPHTRDALGQLRCAVHHSFEYVHSPVLFKCSRCLQNICWLFISYWSLWSLNCIQDRKWYTKHRNRFAYMCPDSLLELPQTNNFIFHVFFSPWNCWWMKIKWTKATTTVARVFQFNIAHIPSAWTF